jgi:NADPH:quinone reductase-like Zn-dependent oxidoreductase
VLRRAGVGPAGVEPGDVPRPEPAADELLVAVRAVSASKLELEQTMTGLGLGRFVRLPRVLGNDPVGVVVAAGPDAPAELVGCRVAIKPNIVCGRCDFCLAEHEADCRQQQMVGVHRDGGAAEFVAVPARQAFLVPDGLDDVTAAAAVHSVAVAVHLLRAAGDPGPGDTVLVTGATGAVGSAAVAVARSHGASVVGATSDPARAAELRTAGATVAVDYAEPAHLAVAVRAQVADGVTHAIETTGRGAVLSAAVDSLAWRGAAVTCASQPGERASVDINALYRFRRTLRGAAATDFADVREALALVAAGVVRPRIAAVEPLERAVAAYELLADRAVTGKVVLTV